MSSQFYWDQRYSSIMRIWNKKVIQIFWLVLTNTQIKMYNKLFKKTVPKKMFFIIIDLIKKFNLVFNLTRRYNQMHYMS